MTGTPKKLLSENALKMLQVDWNRAKGDGTTQKDLCKRMGMQQPTFSQYLRGVIPLNVAFLLRYAQTRKVPPEAVGVLEGISTIQVDRLQLQVLSSTAGVRFKGRYVEMSGTVVTSDAFLIEVDSEFRNIPKGAFLVCENLPCAKNSLVVGVKDDKTIVGNLTKYADSWAIVQPLPTGDAAIEIDKTWILHKVTSIVFGLDKSDSEEFF